MTQFVTTTVKVIVQVSVPREKWRRMYGEPVEEDVESYVRHTAVNALRSAAFSSIEEADGSISIGVA